MLRGAASRDSRLGYLLFSAEASLDVPLPGGFDRTGGGNET